MVERVLEAQAEMFAPSDKLSDGGRETWERICMPFWITASRYVHAFERGLVELGMVDHGGEG